MKNFVSNATPCLIIALLVSAQSIRAESYFHSENTVSTGKVIINGVDMSAGFNGVVGSGVTAKKRRTVDRFSKLAIAGGFDVEYQPGAFAVEIEGDDNLLDLPRLSVNQGTLTVSINQSYKTEQRLVVRIFSPQLDAIKVNGATHVVLNDLKGDSFTANLAGTFDFEANGRVTDLSLKVDGTGDVNTRQLEAANVTVILSGSGDVKLTAKDELNASVFGVGDIIYFGQPKKITRKVVGVGDIDPG